MNVRGFLKWVVGKISLKTTALDNYIFCKFLIKFLIEQYYLIIKRIITRTRTFCPTNLTNRIYFLNKSNTYLVFANFLRYFNLNFIVFFSWNYKIIELNFTQYFRSINYNANEKRFEETRLASTFPFHNLTIVANYIKSFLSFEKEVKL